MPCPGYPLTLGGVFFGVKSRTNPKESHGHNRHRPGWYTHDGFKLARLSQLLQENLQRFGLQLVFHPFPTALPTDEIGTAQSKEDDDCMAAR